MIDEAVHCSIRAVRILVDKPWNEVRSESNHKCLGTDKMFLNFSLKKKKKRFSRNMLENSFFN